MKTNQSQNNNEWKYVQLEDFAKTSSGGTPKSDNPSYYEDGTIPWLTSGEVRKGRVSSFDNFITKKGLENSSAKIFPPKTILVAMYGATAGQIGFLEKEASTNQAICGILPNEKYSSLFLYHYFTTRTKQLLMMGTGAAQPNISQEILRTLDINLPPLLEQNRIVSVLEIWDKSIENLNKKIEIKKQIKIELMHNLLIGKKRLSGFIDKWQTMEIGELLDYEQPNKYIVESTDYDDIHKTPVLTANKAFILGYTNETEGIYKSHPVIIFDDFTMDNKFVNFDFKVKSSAIKILKPKNKDINLKFVFERIQLINVIIGQHRRHYLSEYQYITIDIPNIKEQNAIANILNTADKEITELERKLKIIKDQKKYLLNNLITGVIRTPENLSKRQRK